MPAPARLTKNSKSDHVFEPSKRALRELEPQAAPRETVLIRSEAESRAVMAYLLARKRDERAGSDTHLAAFRRDRQQWRLVRKAMSRIPPLEAMSS
jgi:hypothetical protein